MKKITLHIVFSALILALLINKFSLFANIDLRMIDYPRLLGSGLFFYLGINIFRALKYQVLFGKMIRFKDTFALSCLYTFFVNLLPMRAGEFSFFVLARKYNICSLNLSVSILYLAKLIDLFALIGLFQLNYLFLQTEYHLFERGSFYLSILMQIIILLFLFCPNYFFLLLIVFISKIKFEAIQPKLDLFRLKLEGFAKNIKRALTLSKFGLIFLLSTLTFLFMCLFFIAIVLILDVNITIAPLIYFSILAIIIGSLPVGIASLGTIEAGFTGVLVSTGIEVSKAFSISLIIHGVQMLGYCLLGFTGWVIFLMKK